MKKKISLTGDRPTGPLHIGHYIGSLKNRISMQSEYDSFVMVADTQAITDNFDDIGKVKNNVYQVVADYLSCGIDPKQSTIFIQSLVPELSELTQYLLNLISINRIGHNPTVKSEIKQKGFEESVPAGFYLYPIFQVADIVAFDADVVPVGRDQAPMIELSRHLVEKFNNQYKKNALVKPEALFPSLSGSLLGVDGHKMSKSLNNAIYLKDSRDEIAKKVKKMQSDPSRKSINDPGNPEKVIAFSYLDHFDQDQHGLETLKNDYRNGGIGDKIVKERVVEVLDTFLSPIREKREAIIEDKALIENILSEGTEIARNRAQNTMKRCKDAMGLTYDFYSYIER